MTRLTAKGCIWALCALAARAAAAQEVTLPLTQYEELRAKANPEPDKPPAPPAPFALESADLEITAGPASARVVQTLALTIYSDGWQRVPLGEAGSFTAARFGGLEGRVDVDPKQGWILQVRGKGRHEVTLESVVPVQRDETATRPSWRFALRFPPAAIVRGSLQAPAEVEEVALAGDGIVRREEGGPWRFVASFDQDEGATFTLFGRRTLPERAQLPLRFEATSATAAVLSRTQLRVRGWIEARVAQGRLAELRVPLPPELQLVAVSGPIAGWNVESGAVVVTPLEPVETSLAIELEMNGPPRPAFASPVLIPFGSRRTLPLVRTALQGDGLLELTDPGAVRAPEATETERLPLAIGQAGGRLLAVLDPAHPPRWQVEWAERTEVLAAQIDRLLVDAAVGEAGRASYQLWAEVRNRGAQQLTLALPPGFELVSVRRDGEIVTPGRGAGGALAVPLGTGEAPQIVHLAGIVALTLPRADGDLSLPLPALSAPAARVEVRVVLPGGRSYRLSDATRAGSIGPPPAAAQAKAVQANAIAQEVLKSARRAPPAGAPVLFPQPPGFQEVTAAWSALSASPQPLVLRVEREKEVASWF